VTPAWLADHLKDPNVVVLFMGQPADFEKGHIPGARFVDFRGISLQDSTGKGLALEMPPAQQLHETFVKLGVSDNSRVIVYYNGRTGGPVSIATRLVMTLDHAGLGKNAALLDGGQVAWVAAGNALTTDVAAVQPGHLSALTIKPVIVSADFVRDHIAKPGFSIVDGRAAAFYDGVQTGGGQNSPHKTGHVASAKNVPYTEIVDETGKLKAARSAGGAILEGWRGQGRHSHRILPYRPASDGDAFRRAHARLSDSLLRRIIRGLVAARLSRRWPGEEER
jgi:thiosulfate/3-mercaptopyruvate sulfurtransferase